MSKVKGPTRPVHRDSKSGEFVTKDYAEKHKSTTERERVHINPPSKNK